MAHFRLVCLIFTIPISGVFVHHTHAQSGGPIDRKATIYSDLPHLPLRLGFKGATADDKNGVSVISVYSGSSVTRMRRVGDSVNSTRTWTLVKGDIITKINGRRVSDMADVNEILKSSGLYCLVTVHDSSNDTDTIYSVRLR